MTKPEEYKIDPNYPYIVNVRGNATDAQLRGLVKAWKRTHAGTPAANTIFLNGDVDVWRVTPTGIEKVTAESAPVESDTLPKSCRVTKNPCGTDTWMAGYTCPCSNCVAWVAERPPPVPQNWDTKT